MMSDDIQLLREYAESGSESAFSKIVSRHINLVYSVALRQVRNTHLAEEIAQAVFIILARKAKSMSANIVLSGWLCRAARHVSADTLKIQRRRQIREQEAHMQSMLNENEPETWIHIAPILDDALGSLGQTDHDAVVLRYFEGKDLREVGAVLGMKEDAARMRVNRGLEKLRKFFSRKGVTLSAGAIAASVAANSIQAAPAGLSATALNAALSGGGLTTATIVAATKAIAMTTAQKLIVTVTVAALAGAGIYEARQVARLNRQVRALQQQQGPLAAQVQQLTQERDDAANKLTAALDENEKWRREATEVPKLRGDVTQASRELADLKAQAGRREPVEDEADAWGKRAASIKQWFRDNPDKSIPELRLLNDKDFVYEASRNLVVATTDAERSDHNSMPMIADSMRELAKQRLALAIGHALVGYVEANGGSLPGDLSQLVPYFDASNPFAATVLADPSSILQRYQLLHTGQIGDVPNGDAIIAEKLAVDPSVDELLRVRAVGYSFQSVGIIDAMAEQLVNWGPADTAKLKPFLK
jgi:RNA polymerase sigma factor (sigma-70 family)